VDEPAEALPPAPREIPWRPLTLVLTALLLLALVAATTGYLWLRSYMPIRLAGTAGPAPSSLEVRVVQNAEQFAGKTAYVVSGEHPGRFGAFFDIKNAGRVPITIEGLAQEDSGDSLFPPLKLHAGVEPGGKHYYDFHPFTLDSGETAFLALEVIATKPCEGFAPGGWITWDSVSLRYSYALFFEREASIPMPAAMSLVC
jgi:hypothetical protein